jgi:type IX secretion system substrate protein
MKRKNLPLSLALISIVLGVIALGFSHKQSESKYSPRLIDESSLVYGIKPSVEYLAQIRNNQNTGVIAPEYLEKLQNQLDDFTSNRSSVNMTWRQLGPDNFGGRTRAILFDNQDVNTNTVFAAGVTGGIWKSGNVGTSWFKVNSSNYNLNVSCMKQGANGTIYAGTGESFAAETVSGLDELGFTGGFMGQGIFKSVDGDNFTLIASTRPQLNEETSAWSFVNELAIDMNSGRVYAATNSGLMYSDNEGDSWSVAKDTSGVELNMNSMDVQVSSDGAVVAFIDEYCYISTDGNADAFVTRSTGDSVSLPDANVGRIEFAFAPSDPNILYASVANNLGSLYNIYRSDDKGVNWRIIQPGSHTINIFSGQGIYDNALTVFPENADKIILGGINAWEGEKIQETGYFAWKSISTAQVPTSSSNYLHVDHHTYVFRPGTNNFFMIGTDGGIAVGAVESGGYSFQGSNRSYFTTQFYSIGPSGLGNYVVGGAQDNGTILITGEGNTKNEGEEIYPGDGCACVASIINKDVLVVSEPASEQNFIFRSEDGGVNYSTEFVDDLSLQVSFFVTPISLWESFDNQNSRDSVWYHAKSTIAGGTEVQVISKNSNQPFYYTTPSDVTLLEGDSIIVQDIVSSRLFVATYNKVYMTNELHWFDKVPQWFEISNLDVGFDGSSQCMSYSSDANHLFVGTREGRLYRVSNLALAYDSIHADARSAECIVSTQEIPILIPGTSDPVSQVITSVAVDPENPANVMITLGNYGNDYYVLYSENALDEFPVFTSRQGNLPQMPVYSSIIEMSDTDMAIIGSEHGIFVTEDITQDSPVWMRQDSLMGSVPVFQLLQQRVSKTADTVTFVNGNEITKVVYPGTDNYGVIYAATYGRGLLRCNLFQRPVGIDDNYTENEQNFLELKVFPNPVVTSATMEFESNERGVANIVVYDLAGRMNMSFDENVVKGLNKLDIDLSTLKTGTYIIHIVIGNDVYSQKIIAN